MSATEIHDLLNKNCIFGCAEPQNIQKYLCGENIKVKDFSAGEEIFSPSVSERYIGIVIFGSASVLPANGAQNAMLKILCHGDMFGISNIYSKDLPFPSIISARCACSVLFITAKAFKDLIENDKGALRAYLSLLNSKIGYLNQKICTLTAGSTEKRLALYLCENECGGEIFPTVSMSALADMLNVGRASLYRALDTLAAQGLITRDGKKIIIHDKNTLLNLS